MYLFLFTTNIAHIGGMIEAESMKSALDTIEQKTNAKIRHIECIGQKYQLRDVNGNETDISVYAR